MEKLNKPQPSPVTETLEEVSKSELDKLLEMDPNPMVDSDHPLAYYETDPTEAFRKISNYEFKYIPGATPQKPAGILVDITQRLPHLAWEYLERYHTRPWAKTLIASSLVNMRKEILASQANTQVREYEENFHTSFLDNQLKVYSEKDWWKQEKWQQVINRYIHHVRDIANETDSNLRNF